MQNKRRKRNNNPEASKRVKSECYIKNGEKKRGRDGNRNSRDKMDGCYQYYSSFAHISPPPSAHTHAHTGGGDRSHPRAQIRKDVMERVIVRRIVQREIADGREGGCETDLRASERSEREEGEAAYERNTRERVVRGRKKQRSCVSDNEIYRKIGLEEKVRTWIDNTVVTKPSQ